MAKWEWGRKGWKESKHKDRGHKRSNLGIGRRGVTERYRRGMGQGPPALVMTRENWLQLEEVTRPCGSHCFL